MKLLAILQKKSSINQGAATLVALYFLSSLLSLVREPLLAAKFGAENRLLDAYNMAFGLPDLVFGILILGAVSTAFIPIFIRLKERQKNSEAWEFANSIMNLGILTMTAVGVILFLFAPQLLSKIAFGFRGDEATFLSGERVDLLALTTSLTRLMLISPLLFGISAIAGSIQLTFRRYVIFGLAPIIYNLGILFGLIFLVERFDIYGVAYGVVLGAFLQMLLHFVGLKKLGYRAKFRITIARPELKRFIRLMLFRSATLVTDRIEYLIALSIGSTLAAGITIFAFAFRIQAVPVTIFGAALATAFFPKLAEEAGKIDRTVFIRTFAEGTRQILFFIIPITFFIIITRREVATLILGFGKFGENFENIRITASALAIFSISLFAQALLPILLRAYYALEDTKTPFFVALLSMAVNAAISLYFIKRIGAPGLALGFSAASLLDFGILSWLLTKRLKTTKERIEEYKTVKAVIKMSAAASVMGLAVHAVSTALATREILSPEPFSRLTAYIQFGVLFLVGAAIYTLAAYILKTEELHNLKNFFKLPARLTRNGYRE